MTTVGYWMDQAACGDNAHKGYSPWDRHEPPDPHVTAYAIAVCIDCPVRVECLTFAESIKTSAHPPDGVYGGVMYRGGEREVGIFVGMRFGHLAVLREADRQPRRGCTWLCRCVCGAEVSVGQRELERGRRTSCGRCADVAA